jgi:hypothetical protein
MTVTGARLRLVLDGTQSRPSCSQMHEQSGHVRAAADVEGRGNGAVVAAAARESVFVAAAGMAPSARMSRTVARKRRLRAIARFTRRAASWTEGI